MSVTARFLADFSSFTTQVERAVITARKFETSIDKVETSLDRMADTFSGRRIIEQANLAARAVDEIGGTSKLTKEELERLGNMAAQAVTKMKAIGETAPKRLEELALHAKSSTKELGLMSQVLGKIGPQLAATFSVGAVIAFAKGIGTFAGEMTDLSAETGISTDRLQELNYAAASAGLTVQDITGGINQLSKRLAGDDKSAAAAVEQLRLNIYQLQNQSPDEAFLSISRAIAEIENPMERTRIAMELFGRSGARMLRLMTDDVDGLLAGARAAGAVIDEELIKKADEFDDAWKQVIISTKARFITFFGEVARGWDELNKNRGQALAGVPGATGRATQQLDMGAIGAFFNQGAIDQNLAWFTQRAARGGPLTFGGKDATTPKVGGAIPTMGVPNNVREIEKDVARMETALKKTASATTHAKSAQDAWNESILKANEGMTFMIGRFGRDLPAAIEATAVSLEADLIPPLESAAKHMEKLSKAMPASISSQGASQGVGPAKGLFGSFFGGLKGGLSSMMQDLTGGQGFGGMLGKIGTGIFEGFGNIISGGLSSLIGGGVSLAMKGIGKLFGGGEHSKVNDMRDAFIASAGGITKLAEEAQKAGTSVDRLLSAKKVKDFESAVAALDMQMEGFAQKQQDAADKLQKQVELVEKYGIALGDAPVVRDKVLADQAKGLLDDWQALIDAGVQVTTVQEAMHESIVDYLEAALKAGGEIPESFRPILEALLSTADLADLAGLSLLEMAQMAASGFQRATQEAHKLNAELARNTYGADNDSPTQGGSVDFEPKMFDPKTGSWVTPTLASWQAAGNPSGTESQFRSAFNLDVIGAARNAGFSEDYVNNWARANGGDISRFGRAHNLPGFYGGTGGRYLNFGAGTPAMLHGRERVSTESEGRAEALGFEALCGSIDAMRRDFSTFPEQLRDALQTRVVVAH